MQEHHASKVHEPAAGTFEILAFLAAFAAAWLVHGLTGRIPGYVHHDTAELAMWAHVGVEWGYQKHPPLLAWLAALIETVVPLGFVTLTTLSVANLTVSAYAVFQVAVLTIGRARAPLALALHLLSPFVTFQALKLNHNSFLVSLWPLIVWAFLLALKNPGLRQGLVLGLIAGLGMLAKIQTAMLLAGCLLVTLLSPGRNRLLRSPAPYAAVAVATVLFVPHLLWIRETNANDLSTGLAQRATRGMLPWRLLFNNLVSLLPVLIGAGLLARWLGRGNDEPSAPGRKILWLLVLVPYGLTLLVVMALGLRGSATWTMPIFAVVPVLLAGYVRTPDGQQLRRLRRLMAMALGLIALSGYPTLVVSFLRKEDSAVDARHELAAKGARLWQEAIGGAPRIIAGSHRFTTASMLVVPGKPLGWTEPHYNRPYWIRASELARHGFLAICADAEAGCRAFGERHAARRGGLVCTVEHQRRLLWMAASPVKALVYIVPGAGRSTLPSRPGDCRQAGSG